MADSEPKNVSRDKIQVLAALQDLEASEETWAELRRVIADFFAERATAQANTVAADKGWTDEDFHRMARTHMRTSKRT
jgi:hypothetical protein